MSMRNKWAFSGTMPYGGLTVDEDTGGVTRADGTVIGGLYAAGRTALGGLFGKQLQWAVDRRHGLLRASGRPGRVAAQRATCCTG